MYIQIGDGSFHQGSVIGLRKSDSEKAEVLLALGEGEVICPEVNLELDEDQTTEEKVEEIHDNLKSEAKERMSKRRSQMMGSGGGAPSLG